MLVKAISSNLVRSMVQCSRMGQIRALSGAVDNIGLAEPKHGRKETDEQFDQRYIQYFSRPDIDNWELRKGINDLHGMDLIPEPAIIISVLEAARRLNDHSICVRFLEALRWKSRFDANIYPYLIQEIRPTLDKLGISTPEELGYHEPELAIEDCFDK